MNSTNGGDDTRLASVPEDSPSMVGEITNTTPPPDTDSGESTPESPPLSDTLSVMSLITPEMMGELQIDLK